MAKVLVPVYLSSDLYYAVDKLMPAFKKKNHSQTIEYLVKVAIRRLEDEAIKKRQEELNEKYNLKETYD